MQSLIIKGFYKDVDDAVEFISELAGESIAKMSNVWKNLTPDEKKEIDSHFADFPPKTDNEKEYKTATEEAFKEHGDETIELFRRVIMKKAIIAKKGESISKAITAVAVAAPISVKKSIVKTKKEIIVTPPTKVIAAVAIVDSPDDLSSGDSSAEDSD